MALILPDWGLKIIDPEVPYNELLFSTGKYFCHVAYSESHP